VNPTADDGSGVDVYAGDILDIRPGVAGKNRFRMRVATRELDDRADVVVTGPQLNGRAEGRKRRVVLVSADGFTVIARPRTEAAGYLDVATLKWLGRELGSKWWQMAAWFSGGRLGTKTNLACVLKPSGMIGPILGGNYPTEAAACLRVLEALRGGATEGWVVNADGARQVKPIK
jgi:hypothetical protein